MNMHKPDRSIAILALVTALSGCASYDGYSLKPGVATADQVRTTMGAPVNIHADPDGGESWEYPRGPMGLETYMVRLDRNGVMQAIDQVLDDRGFARIQVGKSRREDVLRAIGTPWRQLEFARRNEVAWDYRFRDAWGYPSQFSVIFDQTGVVKETLAIREYRRGWGWF